MDMLLTEFLVRTPSFLGENEFENHWPELLLCIKKSNYGLQKIYNQAILPK